MDKKTIENGRFKATYHNEKTAYLDGVKIFRHRDGIAFEFNGQLTSINDRGKSSVRGANDLYNKLNAILLQLGVEEGEYEKKKRVVTDKEDINE
ncbi:hypothetical protein [Bacillus toyonensis]|uniref:hypothetical protein n=1 Tax=Bacillus toyonensis TaxID=155322 RepID=UPI0011A17C68|nr:hypothetical protein [Bacillus toyonensis]